MPPGRLTDLTIKNLPPPESGQKTYWDDAVPGFGVRVSQGGSKTFVLVHGVNRERTSIGRYPIISLSDARGKAKEILAKKLLGKEDENSITFGEALPTFLEAVAKRNKPRTLADYKRLLIRHFLQGFARLHLSEIRTAGILKRVDALSATPSEQNHAFVAIGVFFRWARRRRYIENNPCEGLQLPNRLASRSRVLDDRELVNVYRYVEEVDESFGDAVRLLILSGQRKQEINWLKRDYIDTAENYAVLPPEIVKNNREHLFPFGKLASEIIVRRLRGNSPYLFPAALDPEKPYALWSKAKAKLDKLCPIPPWTLHDLRRTFSTNLAEIGVLPHITERLLNHASGSNAGVAAIYNRFQYLEEKRDAVNLYEKKLSRLLSDPCL